MIAIMIGGLAVLGALSLNFADVKFGSSALLIAFIIWVFAMAWKDEYKKFFIYTLLISIMLSAASYGVASRVYLADYQKDRIEVFLNPDKEDQASQFNRKQALIAIGSGGITGKGFGLGTQSRLKILPERTNDFIFAVFAEQFGFVGVVALVTLYFVLIHRIFLLQQRLSPDLFGSLLMIGVGGKMLLEVFLNIATNTGLIPQTGIPLPLLSSGGSITIATLLSLGLVQAVIVSSKGIDKTRERFVDSKEILL